MRVVLKADPYILKYTDEEKGQGVPQAHSGWVSVGLTDSNDTSLTNWNATVFGPSGTNLGEFL
jgi:hypothetical protein